ncbi:L-aspartate oxidase [Nocardia callitridis]|uniref:L-aspartate oxidase n=1 Tax=Nocardia callitridis TaxID=648753 RepID=A0ABP9KKL6_9NOCA
MTSPSIEWEAAADLVVVGGGVAGLTATRAASTRGLRVLTLSKGGPADTATQYAQGGIAVVAPHKDSVRLHVRDTITAGVGLCDENAVRSIVEGGRAAVAALTDLGAVFDLGRDGGVSRTREGGHSTRRIIHAGGDATGAEVQRALNAAGMPVVFGAAVHEVVTGPRGVCGVIVLSDKGFGVVHAPSVLLATGGCGQLYALSTNPEGATADGIALALRAGASVADLEFLQFHPTVLYTAGGLGRRPLVSEAVRGEGAVLVDVAGRSVTEGVHPLGDLAPRDVVSRAIAERMRLSGAEHVYLDARAIDGFAQRFPTITASCADVGIDPRTELIPVAPAAHYQCGGVLTDPHGRTTVAGLYAAGEVARTGLHGANRLASNSLLEGLVVGERAGIAAAERLDITARVTEIPGTDLEYADREVVQRLLTTHASVVRTGAGLHEASELLTAAITRRELGKHWGLAGDRDLTNGAEPVNDRDHVHGGGLASGGGFANGGAPTGGVRATGRRSHSEVAAALEDRALTLAAGALLSAALARTESRGCHTRSDHPGPDDALRHSIPIRLDADGRPRPVTRVSA